MKNIQVNFLRYEFDKGKAFELCAEYSDNAELLKELIEDLKLTITYEGVNLRSNWNPAYMSVCWRVNLNGFEFDFYGSHRDAEILNVNPHEMRNSEKEKNRKERREICNGILYSVLCSVKCDLYLLESEPEDLGFDSDSIKDMAKWNEAIKHAKGLRNALCGVSQEQIDALPS